MQPSSWIWPNSADAKQGINLKWRGGAEALAAAAAAAAAGGAVTKMNGVIPAARMVISLFVTVAPSKSDSVGARDATKRFAIPLREPPGTCPSDTAPLFTNHLILIGFRLKVLEGRREGGGGVGEC